MKNARRLDSFDSTLAPRRLRGHRLVASLSFLSLLVVVVAVSIEAKNHIRNHGKAFVSRQNCLQERLMGLSDGPGLHCHYNGSTTIKQLKKVLQEAEALFEMYKQFDDGISSGEILERREQRRHAGLSIDPTPSTIKCRAWSHLKVARDFIAQAYHKNGAVSSAVSIYHLLVDQCLRMRSEIWEEETVAPFMMNQLSACYYELKQFKQSREWLEKAMHFCEKDGLHELHELLKTNLSRLANIKAGPMATGDATSNKKQWKKCWRCGKKGTKDQKLSRCGKCVTLKLATPAFYCSRECQEQDWPRHKGYHKQVEESRKNSSEFSPMSAKERRTQQEHKGNKYAQLWFGSRETQINGRQLKARHLVEEAIELEPENPSAYNNLANLFGYCHNYQGRISCFLKVMDIVDDGWGKGLRVNTEPEFMRANAAVSVFLTCWQNEAATSLLDNKPDWLLDPEKQLKVAVRAIKAMPNNLEAWVMRADAFEKMGKFDQAIQQYCIAKEKAVGQVAVEGIDLEIKRVQQKQKYV